MKTKLILKYNSGKFFTLGTLRFGERSFFHTLLGFEPYWDYKPTNLNNIPVPGVYITDKILNVNTTNKMHLKYDVIDGSIQDGIRQPLLYSFVLDKKPGYNVFSNLRQFTKKNKQIRFEYNNILFRR